MKVVSLTRAQVKLINHQLVTELYLDKQKSYNMQCRRTISKNTVSHMKLEGHFFFVSLQLC